jgi:acetyl-CoA C-acetyltransferase
MKEVAIVSGSRTAIGTFGGGLKDIPVTELGAVVMKDVLKRVNLRPVPNEIQKDSAPDKLKDQGLTELEKKSYDWNDDAQPIALDEVVMGNVLQAAQGQNTARQSMIGAGIPKETPAYTINKVCGSGLKAIALGAASIMLGQADVVLAGGQESMSLVPIASMYNISRQEQDELGVLSHTRARSAIKEGLFAQEIAPVIIKTRKGEIVFDTDERPMDTDIGKMGKLRPAFKKDGTVTAGNASGINDAAAAVLLMSTDKAKELSLEPIVKIKAFASGGVDPAYMGLGPIPAVRKALKAAGMALSDIGMIELNEAFAAQAIGCMRELGIENDHPNELGSGISLGHPIGCTGARQMVTGMNHMQRNGYNTGLFTMCIGGGMGMAMIVER